MNTPSPKQAPPDPVKSTDVGAGSYPLQLVVLIVIFAAIIGVYIYLTSDGDATGALTPPADAQVHLLG